MLSIIIIITCPPLPTSIVIINLYVYGNEWYWPPYKNKIIAVTDQQSRGSLISFIHTKVYSYRFSASHWNKDWIVFSMPGAYIVRLFFKIDSRFISLLALCWIPHLVSSQVMLFDLSRQLCICFIINFILVNHVWSIT